MVWQTFETSRDKTSASSAIVTECLRVDFTAIGRRMRRVNFEIFFVHQPLEISFIHPCSDVCVCQACQNRSGYHI